MREELNGIERSRQPKERSLAQLRSSLEAMETTKEGLKNELNQVNQVHPIIKMENFTLKERFF